MRRRALRRTLVLFASGGCLWLSCPSGAGPFLAATVQPILTEFFSTLADHLSDQLLGQNESP